MLYMSCSVNQKNDGIYLPVPGREGPDERFETRTATRDKRLLLLGLVKSSSSRTCTSIMAVRPSRPFCHASHNSPSLITDTCCASG